MTILWLIFPIIPNTLDSNEFKDTIKLFLDIKNLPQQSEIYIIDDGERWHYFSGMLFYADKKSIVLPKQEFGKQIFVAQPDKYDKYFVLNKKSAKDILLDKNFISKIKVVKETKYSLLITPKI